MEKQFLTYLLYITLVELREHVYETNDKKTFWLCDLLHNIPSQLDSEENSKVAYNILCENVENLGMQSWLEKRKEEFNSRNQE